ncbi:MAG: hypothetical protein Q9162_000099, partial [Coniocarpon cinnabarinum]
IPESIQPKEVEQGDYGVTIACMDVNKGFKARFRAYSKGSHDSHTSFYSWDWLQARVQSNQFPVELSYWDANVTKDPPTVSFAAIMSSDEGVRDWTSRIRKWGFCYVDGCPVSGEATQKLIERIAFIRPTHYGAFWQFTADLAKKDSAYTQLALAAHTDTTYFTDPAGLQTFHLLSHTDGEGGSSLLVDGFKAAETLRQESPEAYDTLCRIKIRGHASGNETVKFLTDSAYPVLRTEDIGKGEPSLRQVRWNNDDRAALVATDAEEITNFYKAARKWVEILKRPQMEYWEQLRPGRPLTNMDDFISRWKTLNFSPEDISNSV